MVNKRGQVTLFIILAIVIVALALLLFFLLRNSSSNRNLSNEEIEVQTFTTDCLENSLEKGLRYVSLQGGFYELTEPRTNYNLLNTKYYYFKGQIYIPEENEIEKQISYYLNDNLKDCLNYSSFEKRGIFVENSGILTSANFENEKVNAELNTDIKITFGEKTTILKDISVSLDSRLLVLLDVSKKFVQDYKLNNESICLTCNLDLSDKYSVLINFIEREEDLQVKIIDNINPEQNAYSREELVFALKDFSLG